MSESVGDVEHVIKCLLYCAALGSSKLCCPVQYAVDCLYCVATHLLVLQELKDLPPGYVWMGHHMLEYGVDTV